MGWGESESKSRPVVSDSLQPHGLYTVHEILQARILEWVACPFSRGSPQPWDQTQVSRIIGRFFTSWATREAWETLMEDKGLFSNFFVKISGDEVCATSMEEGGGTPS